MDCFDTLLARRRSCLGLALTGALALAGCGGSVALGFGYDGRDDRPPSASLAISVDAAVPGQTLQLVAAASDDYRVDAVEFYRLDGSGRTLLAVDREAPFQVGTVVPSTAVGSVQYFVRAIDDHDQRSDSGVVTVTITP